MVRVKTPYPVPREGLVELPFYVVYKVGSWYATPLHKTFTTTALWSDFLEAHPFPVTRSIRVDRIGIYIKTIDAGKKMRLGIYRDDGAGYPGALVVDAGEIDLGSIGNKELVINETLARGLYWVAWISDSNVSEVYDESGSSPNLFGAPNPKDAATSSFGEWEIARAYGALPDPFPPGANFAAGLIMICLRVAAVL